MNTVKKLLVTLLTTCSLSSFAQETKYTYKMYGFVRGDYYADTRKMNASVLDFFSFYPMYQNLNSAGEDLNALSSSSLVSINSRIGLDITGPAGIFGANKTISKLETDFGGSPNYMLLRIRQAYSQIIWNKSDLLIGQTWHPFFVPATAPNVLSLNAGSPFQPFNRSPMIRYNYQLNKLKLTAAAVYQMMYNSQGPDEASPNKTAPSATYQKNALFPEMFVGLEYKKDKMLVGLGGEYKSIMPNRYFFTDGGIKHVNHNRLNTPAAMVYGVYTSGKLAIRAKAILGQNLTESSLIGGYAITTDNKYIPYNTLASYVHFNYGKTHQVGLMLGYTENMGPSKNIPLGSNFYGFGVDNANSVTVAAPERMIKNIFRLTPTYSYNIKNWQMGLELEYTNANWGSRSAANGKILNLDSAENYRIYAVLMYTF